MWGASQVEPDDDPLGSGDDEADSETEDKDFDTEDTVACQWEKVSGQMFTLCVSGGVGE